MSVVCMRKCKLVTQLFNNDVIVNETRVVFFNLWFGNTDK